MAQNFRGIITQLPNSFSNFQNSMEQFKEITLSEKADNDTFNKSIINKITPIKEEKKLEPSLLETPFIEKDKKQRRISIYSPLPFKIPSNIESSVKNSSNLKITNFNPELSPEIDDILSNFYIQHSLKKMKKIGTRKKVGKDIIFSDEKNEKHNFTLFNDKIIFGENNNIIIDNAIKYLNNTNDDESRDGEKIENDHQKCLKRISESKDYFSKFPQYKKDE